MVHHDEVLGHLPHLGEFDIGAISEKWQIGQNKYRSDIFCLAHTFSMHNFFS